MVENTSGKLSLPQCPKQPWLKAHAGHDGRKSLCSMEERQLPGNILIFRREIPHISFPALKGGQSSATCKKHQAQFGFYMDNCKYKRSMYSKALTKNRIKEIPQTSHITCCRMPTFYTCRTLIHLQQHVKLKPSIQTTGVFSRITQHRGAILKKQMTISTALQNTSTLN